MVDILHRIAIEGATPDEVYDALATVDGLAGWWTRDTTGDADLGGTVAFRFPLGGFDMEVVEAIPSEKVRWKVVDGPPEWVGTTVAWDLKPVDGYTAVLFAHEGWREPVEFMHHCSTKWGTYLMSLKALVETGAGAPCPDDVRISETD